MNSTATSAPKVSVIVPVYNAARYLATLIESLTSQSYGNIEIILVNDCSTDRSLDICRKYARKDKRIVIVDKPRNEGVDLARFSGLEKATGEFITFADADDWADSDYISTMAEIAVRENVDIVYVGMRRVYSRLLNIAKEYPFCRPALCDRRVQGDEKVKLSVSWMGINILPVTVWGALFSKRLFEKPLCKSGLRHGDDLAMTMQLFERAESFYLTDKKLYNYRWGGVTSKFQPQFLQSIKYLFPLKLAFCERTGIESGRESIAVELANCLATHIRQMVEYCDFSPDEFVQEIKREMSEPIYSCFADIREIPYFKDGALNTACARLDARAAYDIVMAERSRTKLKRILKRVSAPIIRLIS